MSAQLPTPELPQPFEGQELQTSIISPETKLDEARKKFRSIQGGLQRRLDEIKQENPEIVKEEIIDFARQADRMNALDQSVSLPVNSDSQLAQPRSIVELHKFAKDGEVEKPIQGEIENEFNDPNIKVLTPLKEISVGSYGEDLKINNQIKKEMEYLSRTANLEWESERVAKLQAISDGMAEDTGIQTRIVIINKGFSQNAFVMPDGTIFISQDVLNKLPTLDRVGGVIGHEFGHLENDTFGKQHKANGRTAKFGVGWIHEAKGDSDTPKRLEKVGLNSMGLALAINDISGGERGSIHQTGIARASQNVMQHGAVDYITSNQPEQLLTTDFKAENVKKTNKEIIQETLNKSRSLSKEEIEKLHPQDFDLLIGDTQPKHNPELPANKHYLETLAQCQEVLQARLELQGYSEQQITLFLFSTIYPNIPVSFIHRPEELVTLAEETIPFNNKNMLNDMRMLLFNREPSEERALFNFLEHIQRNHFDVDRVTQSWGIPVTQDTLLRTLEIIKDGHYYHIHRDHYSPDNTNNLKHKVITRTLYGYLDKLSLQNKITQEEMREFLIKARDTAFKVDVDELARSVGENDIVTLFREVFNQEKKRPKTLEELMDDFFADYEKKAEASPHQAIEHINDFFGKFRNTLDSEKVSDSERLVYLNRFYERVGKLPLETQIDLRQMLDDKRKGSWGGESKDIVFDKNVMQYQLRLHAGLRFFKQDGNEFYTYINRLMNESGLDADQLSSNQIINLHQSIFETVDSTWSKTFIMFGKRDVLPVDNIHKTIELSNFDRLSQLPYIRALIGREYPSFQTLQDLNRYLADQEHKLYSLGGSKNELFSDNLYNLMTGHKTREMFLKIVEKGVPESEYQDLWEFVYNYYPSGPEKDHFLREINRKYLSSPEVTIENKTLYLKTHFNRIGIEGMVTVAEQINELSVYKKFREEMGTHLETYLAGSDTIAKVALGDFITSYVTPRFDELFKTAQTDKEVKSTITNDLLIKWYQMFFVAGVANRDITFDPETGRVALTAKGRITFRTFRDFVDTLHNLSPLERAGVAMKALTDKGGGLTSDANRTKLGELLLSGLNVESTFVRDSIQKMIETAPPEYLSFPASQMLSPMLFRAIDMDSVDVRKLYLEQVTPADQAKGLANDILEQFVKWDTRSVTRFGARYTNQPGSFFLRRSGESDTQYKFISHHLRARLIRNENNSHNEKKTIVDPSTEAVISGIEATGSLGVRSLQLARGVKRFSPHVDRRLADTFDANPGLKKILFWENLIKLSEQDPAIRDFVENKIVKVEEKLGGGSQFTTYRAKVRGEHGEIEKAVVKMLNPNALLFVGKTYNSAQAVLQSIADSESSSAQDKRYAQMGMMLIDLAREWCLRDINDPHFLHDDALFRQTIDRFNTRQGENSNVFVAPDVLFNSMKLKSEKEAESTTLNQYLNNPNADKNRKREAVKSLGKFFVHQIRDIPFVDEMGREVRLVHSDPHVGNYMIMENSGETNMAVIDRSMYLHLTADDVAISESLLKGDKITFVKEFINRVCDLNNWKGAQKLRFTTSVFKDVLSEYGKQKLTRQDDSFALLRILSERIEGAGQTIPLEMRLMIRNVQALQKLMQEYKISYKDITS